MSRLLELPAAMRDHGVDVVEVAGWQARGRSFARLPVCGVDHWTVGAARGEAPSLSVVTYGRSDLTGPLCNVLRGRRVGDRRPRAFMVAAGVSNNAGRGELRTSSGRLATGNGDTFGLEVEYRPWSERIVEDDLAVDVAIHAAAAELCGYTADDVVGHFEWAVPRGRKTDRSTVGGPALRDRVRLELERGRAPIATEEGMHMDYAQMLENELRWRRKIEGDLPLELVAVVVWWQTVIGDKPPAERHGAYRWVLAFEPAFAA